MALNLYRRHPRIAGDCVGGHVADSRSYEPDELRRGWKKCHCPIYVCGALKGQFRRRNTEQFRWEEARRSRQLSNGMLGWKPDFSAASHPGAGTA